MILVEFAAFDTVNDLLRIHMVLFVYYLHYSLLNDQVFTVEVYEVRLWWLVSHAEFTRPELPKPQAVSRVHKDLGEEFLGLSWKNSLLLVFARDDTHLFLLWSVAFKRQLSCQYRIERDPQTPNIYQLWIVAVPLDDFGRRVRRSAADSPPELPKVRSATEAKVDEFHIPILIEHDVLRLNVPVAESALLEIQQGW